MTVPVERDDLLTILRDHERRISILERVQATAPTPTDYIDYIENFTTPTFYFPGNEVSGCLVDLMNGQQLCPNTATHVYGITSGVPTGVAVALGCSNLDGWFNPNAPATGGPFFTEVTDFSFQIWAFQPSATASQRFLLENGRQFASVTGWGVQFLGATNQFRWGFDDGSTIDQSGTAPEGVWYHLLGTMDATTATFYIDGSSVGTATPTIGTPTTVIGVGNWQGNVTTANGWNGQWAHLGLWDRVLTSTEIANLYDYGLNGTP